MGDKTANADRTIVTKGTAHVAVAIPPDVCKVPGAGPAPFPNKVKSEKLAAGATQLTFVDGQPIFTADGELGPSEPAHAGAGGGVGSGTYQGEAKASSWSNDVFAEGAAVVRAFDSTTHNHTNTAGLVLPEALAGDPAFLAALAKLRRECLAGAAVEGSAGVSSTPG
jgi:hypothetical protein